MPVDPGKAARAAKGGGGFGEPSTPTYNRPQHIPEPLLPEGIKATQLNQQRPSPQFRRSYMKHGSLHPPLLVCLVLLTILVILAGSFGLRLLNGGILGARTGKSQPGPFAYTSTGSEQTNPDWHPGL